MCWVAVEDAQPGNLEIPLSFHLVRVPTRRVTAAQPLVSLDLPSLLSFRLARLASRTGLTGPVLDCPHLTVPRQGASQCCRELPALEQSPS